MPHGRKAMSDPLRFFSHGPHHGQHRRHDPNKMYSQKPPKPTRRFSSITGTPFLEHPAAQGGSFNIQPEAEPSHDQNVPAMPRSVSNSSSGTVLHHELEPLRGVSSRTTSDKPMVTCRETAERLAQAAKQLYEQVKESIGIYQSFYDKYNQDINSVRDYVNAVTRRQIWRNKVDQNKKFSQGQEGEDHQLEYQAHKLKVCFDRFSDAVHDVAATNEPRDADAHDPRHFLLEKSLRHTTECIYWLKRQRWMMAHARI